MISNIRPRRLFVSGGSRLSANAAKLWRELGQLLAVEDGLIVITGGLAGRAKDPETPTADRMIIEGMLPILKSRGIPSENHIETVLPDSAQDTNKLIRFKEGHIRQLEKRNPQSRRFTMVRTADVVVSIEGEQGTKSVLDMALAIERPVLPLPFGEGASRDAWLGQREDIINWFQIPANQAAEFERINLLGLTESEIHDLAVQVHSYLMKGFTQGCFVIMKFSEAGDLVYDQAIQPALATFGFQAWRTDRTVPSGDVVAAIRDGINHCYFSIADTTEDRPNVMYELGLVHATNKPVILLRRLNPDGSMPPAPFDFQTQSILKYGDDLRDLRRRLEDAIAIMCGLEQTPGSQE